MEFIAPGIYKISLGIPENITPVSLRRNGIEAKGLERLPEAELPFSVEKIGFQVTARGCTVELPLANEEGLYGFGLQLKSFNQRGLKKVLRTNSDPVADTGDSHAPVPFYCSTAGYGVLVDTARNAAFYCGTHDRQGGISKSSEESNAIGANPSELYAMREHKGQRAVAVDIPAAKGVDLYLFCGPNIIHAVQRYNLFSGGGCLPPMWGLGVWYRIWGKANQAQAEELALAMRQAKMPCDVFGLEPGWHSHSYSCSYQWNKERFPDPDKMVSRLNGLDFKVNLWEHAFTHPSAPFHDDMKPYSGDYEVWGGLVPDFSMVEVQNLFGGYHKEQFVQKGIAGFKLDECDSSDYCSSPWSFPDCSIFPSGMDGEQMHNALGTLYQHTLQDVFHRVNRRTLSQCRSSHAIAASLPFVLYSDLYDHKDFIRGVVNSGFSGLLWSPEVRQCNSVEELIRRVQSVVFSAQTLVNAWMIPNPPWLQVDLDKNMNGEFLDNAAEVEAMCRRLFQLRMSLLPYLYSAFSEYRFDGIPPFRALVMDYPEDLATHGIDDEYMMGRHILVAPVIAGETGRRIYLPKGNWYCYWTNERYTGGQWYQLNVPLEQIPLFVQENSLLPLANPVECITDETCFSLYVRCYGTEPCDFTLFEDDMTTYDYEQGSYNTLRLARDGSGYSVTHMGNDPARRYEVAGWDMIP